MYTCREPFGPPGGQTPVFQGMGQTLRVKVSGRETRGRCAVMEYEAEPGVGLSAHVHHREDVMLFVLRGRFDVTVGSETRPVGPGDFVFVPRGVVRAWRCAEDAGEAGCFQITVTPGGLEEMFGELEADRPRACADADGAAALRALLCNIAARYDVTFLASAEAPAAAAT